MHGSNERSVSAYLEMFHDAMNRLNVMERDLRALHDALPAKTLAKLLADIEMARQSILDDYYA